jgi:hypothetical protein
VYICQNETPYRAISNKQKCHFLFKNTDEEGKISSVWVVGISKRGRIREKVEEGEYCGNIMYTCM